MALHLPTLAFLSLLFAVPNGGWLGVYLKDDQPVLSEVIPGSPADKAGLKPLDRVLSIAGQKITNRQELVDAIRNQKEGAKIRISVQRGEQVLAVDVVLGAAPTPTTAPAPTNVAAPVPKVGAAPPRPLLGVELEEAGGVIKVVRVLPQSPAEKAGLRNGQTVVRMSGRPVRTIEDLDGILSGIKVGQRIQVQVQEAGAAKQLMIEVGTSPVAGQKPASVSTVPPAPPAPGTVPYDRPVPAPAASARPEKPAEAVRFMADFETATAEARKAEKPMVLVFGAPWCASSEALKQSFNDPGVCAAAAGFVAVWIDTDREGRIADQFKVQGIPLVVLQAPSGNQMHRAEGYLPPERLSGLLTRHGKPAAKPATPEPPRRVTPPAADSKELEALQQEVRRLKVEVETLRRKLEAAEKQRSGNR